MSALALRGLAYAYPGGRAAVAGVDLALAPGELLCLVGPNGSGKSTLLRLAAGLLAPGAGRVELDGRPLAELRPRERARRIAFVPQALRALPDVDVEGFVLGGRYAHQPRWQSAFRRPGAADRAALARALREADVEDLAGRHLDELSHGQYQRVRMARALAQEAPLFLLDEPSAGLDPEHQVQLFLLIERAVAAGRTALVVTHELNLAGRFAARCVVLERGRVAAQGTPAEVFRPAVLGAVFGPHLYYGTAAADGPDALRPLVVPWPAPDSGHSNR
ncbi:MAG TPA: ABC transporter ATP-binding protein [Planctomycetota bacterium]